MKVKRVFYSYSPEYSPLRSLPEYLRIGANNYPLIGYWRDGVYYSYDDIERAVFYPTPNTTYKYDLIFKGRYVGEDLGFAVGDVSARIKKTTTVPESSGFTDDLLKQELVKTGGVAGIYQSLGGDNPRKLACG